MALVYLAPLIVTQFVMLEQKISGHTNRSQANGAKPLEILIAHFLFNTLMAVFQVSLMMGASLIYFEASNLGSIMLLLAIVFMEGLAGVSLAVFLGSIINNKLTAMVMIYGLTVSLWFICGVFWPVENNNFLWLQPVVRLFPLTLPADSARFIMNRGWDLFHMDVLLGFVSTTVYTIVFAILSFVLFK